MVELSENEFEVRGVNYVIDNGKRMKIRMILIYFVG